MLKDADPLAVVAPVVGSSSLGVVAPVVGSGVAPSHSRLRASHPCLTASPAASPPPHSSANSASPAQHWLQYWSKLSAVAVSVVQELS